MNDLIIFIEMRDPEPEIGMKAAFQTAKSYRNYPTFTRKIPFFLCKLMIFKVIFLTVRKIIKTQKLSKAAI